MFTWKCANGFPLHCYGGTKYLVLLLTINVKYDESVAVLLPFLSGMQIAFLCGPLLRHLCPVWTYRIFPHYPIKGTILGEKIIDHKQCVFIFSATLYFFSESFLILRRIKRNIINVHTSSCEVPSLLVRF